MRLLCLGVALFLIPLVFHLVLWRIRLPQRQTRALLLIFLGLWPCELVALQVLPSFIEYAPVGCWEYLHLVVCHLALSLAYVVLYSALEEDSPSMAIVQF